MEFIDLSIQQRQIKDLIDANIQKVLNHGNYIMGPEVSELEEKLATYIGVGNAISCASGTDALLMALMAKRVGQGDAIITTPFTFIATAEVISLIGATPVFVDIDPDTFNINPENIEKAVQALKKNDSTIYPLPKFTGPYPLNPRGVIAVDLYGLPADYDNINRISQKHGMFVIEDAAQSFGAEYKGKKAGALADIACTSFFPAKPLGCYGDGGMCFTNDDNTADILRSIRIHGKGGHKYDNVRIGINGRLDTLQAGILLAKFKIFPDEVERRQQVAERYFNLLRFYKYLTIPNISDGFKSAWAQYSVLARNIEDRNILQKGLSQKDIPTAIYYPKSLHVQKAFEYLGYKAGDLPVCESYSQRIFSLPFHPYLKEPEQQYIAQTIDSTFNENKM